MQIQLSDHFTVRRLLRFTIPSIVMAEIMTMTMAFIFLVLKRKKYYYWDK